MLVLADGFQPWNRPCNGVQHMGAQALWPDSTYKLTFRWCVDTKVWKQVLSKDASGRVLNGSRLNLSHAVKTGADVCRVRGDTVQDCVYKAQHLAVSGWKSRGCLSS